MLELPRMLWTVFWKSRDLVQTVEKNLDQQYFFISAKTHFENIFQKCCFQNVHRKNSKFRNVQIFDFRNFRKSEIFDFRNFENLKFSIFKNFNFSDENFWKQTFRKIFSKYVFAEMKIYFWSRFFSTVWTKSLDFQKTVQSTRGSSSMPRQGIAFRGCL